MITQTDYAGLNRALKRRVKAARAADAEQMLLSTDFVANVSQALDELVTNKRELRREDIKKLKAHDLFVSSGCSHCEHVNGCQDAYMPWAQYCGAYDREVDE